MRVMVCRDDGTLGLQHDIYPGQAFVLQMRVSNDGADIYVVGDGGRVYIGPNERDRLDLADRLIIGFAVLAQFVAMVSVARAVDSWLESAMLLGAAWVFGYLLRKFWRATS